jgi:hypothetical protein
MKEATFIMSSKETKMLDHEWLHKKTPRAVDQLRLWPENPRLNPTEQHVHIADYAEDLTNEDSDKKHFFKLVQSIVDDGFIHADPVVVWQNAENSKFYVAEGNRRLLAMKLLRYPTRSPKSIRGFIRKQSEKIDRDTIEKIFVAVAPSFEAAEWYINQRNSSSSLQRSWSRIQQQRWISDLFHKHDGDIEHIISITKMSRGELEDFVRMTKLMDLVEENEVKSQLTDEEYDASSHYRFPITIIERFFLSNATVSEKWGIKFDGMDIVFESNKSSFLKAFAALLKRILDKNIPPEKVINTRTITANLDKILDSLPTVSFDKQSSDNTEEQKSDSDATDNKEEKQEPVVKQPIPSKPIVQKNNPYRLRLVLSIYSINTSNYRLKSLFNELKNVPVKYCNSIAASTRIFLDLAVLNYLEAEGLSQTLQAQQNLGMKDITLSRRLEFIKQNSINSSNQKIINKILNPSNEYSLDVLNGYVHSNSTHHLNQPFLNGFWDFLFPLFQELVVINENN